VTLTRPSAPVLFGRWTILCGGSRTGRLATRQARLLAAVGTRLYLRLAKMKASSCARSPSCLLKTAHGVHWRRLIIYNLVDGAPTARMVMPTNTTILRHYRFWRRPLLLHLTALAPINTTLCTTPHRHYSAWLSSLPCTALSCLFTHLLFTQNHASSLPGRTASALNHQHYPCHLAELGGNMLRSMT